MNEVQVIGRVIPEIVTPVNDNETLQAYNIPLWMRELAASRINRTSRASSIISTRTRFSTTTHFDDARSIDIQVGGQYFRISRDGSQITDAPPPYSEPSLEYITFDDSASEVTALDGIATPRSDTPVHDDADSTPALRPSTPRSFADLRPNIMNPSEIDIPSPITTVPEQGSVPSLQQCIQVNNSPVPERTPSYKTGPEVLNVTPILPRTRTVSQNDIPLLDSSPSQLSSPLKRSNGVRLPSLVTDVHTLSRSQTVENADRTPPSPLQIRSAGPILSTCEAEDGGLSPAFIQRNIHSTSINHKVPRQRLDTENISIPGRNLSRTSSAPLEDTIFDVAEDDHHHDPPAMDSENDISLHYARLMRRLDRDHRKELHAKDQEMASYRERLNEMDTVYRQQLKARDFVIDDLKKRLEFLESNIVTLVEKARFQVEDTWEKRWKDRDFHLRERMRRLEEEAENLIEESTGRKVLLSKLVPA